MHVCSVSCSRGMCMHVCMYLVGSMNNDGVIPYKPLRRQPRSFRRGTKVKETCDIQVRHLAT